MREQKSKNEIIDKTKSYIKYYWFSWILLLIIVFFIKDGLLRKGVRDFTNLAMAYFIVIGFSLMIINFYEGSQFTKYIKTNHYEKWKEITTWLGMSGCHNGFRSLKFIFSKDDLNDPMIKQIKSIQKKFLIFLLIVFFSTPIITIALVSPVVWALIKLVFLIPYKKELREIFFK